MPVSPTARATTARMRRFLPAMIITGAVLAAACSSNDDNTTVTPKASAIAIISGNAQTGVVGTALPLPLVVKVTDQNGAAMSGVVVNFTASGGATLRSASATTDANGQATDSLTLLGSTVGSDTVTASVSGVTTSAIFAFCRRCSRSLNSGMTWHAKSSSASQMCSCRLRPPCWMKAT